MSAELGAKVHWTLGRAFGATADDAAELGADLIAAIQLELQAAYECGAESVRPVLVGGGGGGAGSTAYRGGFGTAGVSVGSSGVNT